MRIQRLHSSCILITLLTLASACGSEGVEGQPLLGAGGNAGATTGGIGGNLQGGGTVGSTMAGAGLGGMAGAANGGNAATAGAAGSGGAAAGGAGGSGGSAGGGAGGPGGAAAGGAGGSGGSAGGGTGGSGFVDPGTEGDGDFTVDDFSVPPGVPGAPQGSFSGDGRWGGDDVNINITSDLFPGDHAVQIFIPDQYVNGTEAPFMIAADGLNDFLGGDILLDGVRNRAAADDERQVPPLSLQPDPPEYPNGAWDYAQVITDSPVQEGLRVFLHVGENDQLQGGTRNWIDGNQNLAMALADKGYHYRFVTVVDSPHCDRRAIAALLPETLTWLWRGYVAN